MSPAAGFHQIKYFGSSKSAAGEIFLKPVLTKHKNPSKFHVSEGFSMRKTPKILKIFRPPAGSWIKPPLVLDPGETRGGLIQGYGLIY